MPLFISDSELQAPGVDVSVVVQRAETHIRDLQQQLETHKARADAASISAEQRCAVIEQKFFSVTAQYKQLESEKTQLDAALGQRSAELAQAQAQVHKLELESMKRDSDREHILCELNEVRKARRDLLEVVDQKNAELNEKNSYIKAYLDKIVFLTDERGVLEGKVREFKAEMARSQALQDRLSQEKELLEQHNLWLNEELTEKVNTLLKERRKFADIETELRSKISMAEQLGREAGESLQRSKEQVKDMESKLSQTREELRFIKEDAASKEDHYSLEVATASKLADLYKQSSEEWSKKATDLEGVIKALEAHLNQVEADSKEQLEREVQARQKAEKEAEERKEKLEKVERELESYKNGKEQDSLIMISTFSDAAPRQLDLSDQQLSLELHGEGPMLPVVPSGISGTALAAALLRDGWSLTKVYVKYQEAVDAWHHERQDRRQSQALLQRVLHEIEQRADVIMDERAEHAQMVEAYSVMEEKLHLSIEEQSSLETSIRELKADLRKRERDLAGVQKECSDLQSQVTVLLKECTDIQQRFGVGGYSYLQDEFSTEPMESDLEVTASDAVISERLLTFKDIKGMVEQNSQLRALVRSLGHQNEEREKELKEAFDSELRKRTDEAACKVSTILKKSEEQTELIASLQGTVGMYRRLYEEEVKSHSVFPRKSGAIVPALDVSGGEDMRSFIERSQEEIEKVRKEASERLSSLEEELRKARKDVNAARSERDRLAVEATYAREQLQTIIKDCENQRKEMDAVLARNVEFSQMITDYQRRSRENSEYIQTIEEKSRRLSIEASVLEREKELISNAERRASKELSSLSDRVHRLQATLDNIHTVEEARESMRSVEKKKLEEEANRLQKEWVEMKHELDSERAHIWHLTNERDQVVKQAMDRVECISKELADALRQVSVAETRAHVAEVQCKELEANLKKDEEKKIARGDVGQQIKGDVLEPHGESALLLEQLKDEADHLREELDASRNHTEQYKRLAQINEEALIQMEEAHSRFKEEAGKAKESLEVELSSLLQRLIDLEKNVIERDNSLAAAEADRDRAVTHAEEEIRLLRESESLKWVSIEKAEERIKALKDELEKEHQQWRTAQNNYERQVLLQADTIRELTMLSEQKATLERELAGLQSKAETSLSELNGLRVAWEMEKSSLVSEKDDLSNKVKELDEQNRILLDRVEAMHILIAEHEKKGGESSSVSGQVENNLQDVIRYLRRSKEASDTEISLLKQERLRLQKQLESALHSAEDAQASLRREHESARATLCTDEEFKSLQAQVREITLLRESNAQLRLENKRNFEECQSLRERVHQEKAEVEVVRKSLREREVELEAAAKDSEVQAAEITRWENRVTQLLQKYKSLDVEEYQRTQTELNATQERLKMVQADLDASRGQSQILQDIIPKLEQEASVKDERVAELGKRIEELLQSEGACKAETEKYKKNGLFMKRKIGVLIKEKDEITKEKEGYLKQIEELKATSGRRGLGDSLRSEAQIRQDQHEQSQKENENLLKEKDSRIQILERTLEREREELRKEKTKRQKDQKQYFEFLGKQNVEKQKLQEELNTLRREKDNYAENMQARKTVRTRIIRPKIEPPGQSEVQAEAGEGGNDMAVEVSEAEADVQDESKLLSTAVLETSENIGTTSAIVIAPNYSAPVPDGTAGVRKRSSILAHELVEETSLEQNSKNEGAPLLKKQRGLDLKQVGVGSDSASVTVAESPVTTEAYKDGNMEISLVAGHELQSSDRNDVREIAGLENEQVADMNNSQRDDWKVEQTESMAAKRPQISGSDPSVESQTAVQRDDGAEEEKTVSAQLDQSSERSFMEDRDEQSLNETGELVHHDTEGSRSPYHVEDKSVGVSEQGLKSSLQLILVEKAAVQASFQENIPVFESERAENMLVDRNTDASIAPDDLPAVIGPSVLEVQTISATDGIISDLGGISEVPTDRTADMGSIGDSGLTMEGDGDVEDGEIEPDGPVDNNVESLHQQISVDIAGDIDKSSGSFSLDAVEMETQHPDPDETQVDEKSGSATVEPSQKSKEIDELSTELRVEHKVEAVERGPEGVTHDTSGSNVLSQQAGKSTIIHLAERVRERALIRRNAIPPPSPGKRNLRSSKKSLAVQRGRTTTDAQPQGAGDEETKPSQTLGPANARHSGSQSGTQKEEKDQ